jgi:predicted Zn-dependent peptidase
VVGPFDAPAKLAEIRALFGSIPPGGEPAPEVAPLHTWSFPAALDLEEDLPPVEVAVLGYPLPPPGGPEADALDLLAEMLAGDQVDRVREILVERRGKAVEAGLEQLDYRMGGGLVFYSASLPYRRKGTAFRLLDETLAELARLDWLTPDRLRSAQRARIRRAAGSTYTALGRAGDIGAAHWWLADERRAFDAIERIRAVTVADVEAVFRTYVTDARPIRLYVRPRRVPWYVAAFGWLAPLVGP